MELTSFKTIEKAVEAVLFKERKSKFFAYAYPLDSEDSVKTIVAHLKKNYPTANHVCYAWQLGIDQPQYRANDDGEPNNSAGQPIYGQIQAYGVTNIAVFVVRIFGGTKLGVGGLITAYKTAAQLVLEEAQIIEKERIISFELNFDYNYLSFVMSLIKKLSADIINQESAMKCKFILAIAIKNRDEFIHQLQQQHKIEIKSLD